MRARPLHWPQKTAAVAATLSQNPRGKHVSKGSRHPDGHQCNGGSSFDLVMGPALMPNTRSGAQSSEG
jgi:hypothetical protein